MHQPIFIQAIRSSLLSLLLVLTMVHGAHPSNAREFVDYEWTEINPAAEWTPRAGLQVVSHGNTFYLMGGRTPRPPSFPPIPGDSDIWGDVWKSVDQGKSWTRILETDDSTHWPARAYFRAVTKGAFIYVLGGQNFQLIQNPDPSGPPFISASEFFHDVWRSRDGVHWEIMTEAAEWAGRAGLSSAVFKSEIYVMGGSFNDDPAVIGGPPIRVYFNDVWKSRDGKHWELVTAAAPWAPRAGAIAVVKNGFLYLLGGEDGFLCLPDSRCPPYYNDVWRSRDGAHWELVTPAADWPPRPGHQAAVLHDQIVLFGGFGLSPDPTDPFAPANPMDVWVSKDGATWQQVSDSPWNASSPEEIKYDFAAVVAQGGPGGLPPSIFTFGGDRETFDFTDPTNYLNVDHDVWRFSPPRPGARLRTASNLAQETRLHGNLPNPFNPTTRISFDLIEPTRVTLRVYDLSGRLVRSLVDGPLPAARHHVVWDGMNEKGVPVPSGVYFTRFTAGASTQTTKMVLMK